MERVDLAEHRYAERQRWRSGDEWNWSAPKVAVGQLADGRWYVRRYHDPETSWLRRGVCAYAGPAAEHYARATARRWIRTLGGDWAEA